MNKLTIIGRLVKDAALRYAPSGDPVADISLAVDDGYGDKKSTIWFKCSLWGKRAVSLEQYLTKGTQVYVEGRLNHEDGNPRVWGEGKASFEMTVQDIKLLGGGRGKDNAADVDAEDVSFL